jgi:hypothetical protein
VDADECLQVFVGGEPLGDVQPALLAVSILAEELMEDLRKGIKG